MSIYVFSPTERTRRQELAFVMRVLFNDSTPDVVNVNKL